MQIEVQGSGDNIYTVDTEKVTCTCANFRYRCTHHTIDREERLCKHLVKVFTEHPEFKPIELIQLEKSMSNTGVGLDGKMRYPRSVFDPYVHLISNVLSREPSVKKFEVCGSYRRMAEVVSDLDILIVLNEGASWDPILDIFESVYSFNLVKEIGRGDKKAGYLVDNFIRVDFKTVEMKNWPFALLHFTGSKASNIELRSIASRRGMKLNEYGLFNSETEEPVEHEFNDEKDIFEFLNVQYKYPWER